jgi:hypothetical protein
VSDYRGGRGRAGGRRIAGPAFYKRGKRAPEKPRWDRPSSANPHPFTVEQILEVWCLVCLAPPGQWCRREMSEFRSLRDRVLAAQGTPRSHMERLWLRQGHDPAGPPPCRKSAAGTR